MLSVENVTKKYGSFTALEDISLTFERGVYGLLAPNGAGKTTLIKMLVTLLFPTGGVIRWDGRDILSMGGDWRGMVGYLPQQFGYYKSCSPRSFMAYMAALQCMDRKTARPRIDQLLDLVGLSDVRDRKMRAFSGGMLQRVGIAQAMLTDPAVLILDEPTAGLDPKERVRFRNLIHSLASDRIVILSTHIVSDIETIADRIVLLRDHKLYACDSPASICRQLAGKIYAVPAGTSLGPGDLPLSEYQGEAGAMVRVFSEAPPAGAAAVTPGLEDAFLYIYRDGQT